MQNKDHRTHERICNLTNNAIRDKVKTDKLKQASSTQIIFEGQEDTKECVKSIVEPVEREQNWKVRCKDARDMALNPNLGGLTFKQIGELIQIEEEHEFFALFGDFILINKEQP